MSYKFENPIRLIELFAGYGSQALALKYLGIPFEHHFVCEFDKYAIQSYNEIHGTDFSVSDVIDITTYDLNITETDKYKYLLTYTFPCTDLSMAGKRMGMQRESGTSSSLLWEVERLLGECEELPQYLLMENVPQVIGKQNISLFREWVEFLTKLGYRNYYKLLNAKDFGVPQNRERCFMVSILKTESVDFSFPEPKPLEKRLKDVLETPVCKKYFLSDTKEESIRRWKVHNNPLDSILNSYSIVPTLTTRDEYSATSKIYCDEHGNKRILTPIEHFRLMGVRDKDYIKLTIPTSQKYKQAGNSIVVDVLMAIFENMFIKDCKSNRLF